MENEQMRAAVCKHFRVVSQGRLPEEVPCEQKYKGRERKAMKIFGCIWAKERNFQRPQRGKQYGVLDRKACELRGPQKARAPQQQTQSFHLVCHKSCVPHLRPTALKLMTTIYIWNTVLQEWPSAL